MLIFGDPCFKDACPFTTISPGLEPLLVTPKSAKSASVTVSPTPAFSMSRSTAAGASIASATLTASTAKSAKPASTATRAASASPAPVTKMAPSQLSATPRASVNVTTVSREKSAIDVSQSSTI